MKLRVSVLLMLLCECLAGFSQPANTKYLIYTLNGKSGLTDLNGKTVVEPEYDVITTYTDEFLIGKKNGKFLLVKTDGKLMYTFTEQRLNSECLERGGLVVSADSTVYLFSKNLQLQSKLGNFTSAEAFSHVLALFFQEKQGNGVLCSVNLYDNKTFRPLGRYQLLDCDGFEFQKSFGNRYKPYFSIAHMQDGKPAATILDTTGKLILSHALPSGSTLNDLIVFRSVNDRLYGQGNYPSELVNEYYKGKDVSKETKNLYLLIKNEKELETPHWVAYDSDGKAIQDFGKNAELDSELLNRRTDEIAFLRLTTNESVNGPSEYFIDKKFRNLGAMNKKSRDDNRIYNRWQRPQNETHLVLIDRNNQLVLYSPLKDKEISAFTPDPINIYKSKGLIPVSGSLHHNTWFAYKENDNYGMYNLRSDKKSPLFSFSAPGNEEIEEIEVKEMWRSQIFEISISLRGANEDARDTAFYYLLTSKGEFKNLNGEAGLLSPWRAYDTINREQVSFQLPLLWVKTSRKYHKKILDRDGKELIDLKDNMLYCVGTGYLGLSDGKTSTLFDLKLKQVKKNIPGTVCASIEGHNDLLCFENGIYTRFKNGKSTPLFTENELMGWDKNFVNDPDSDNYQERQMIVHVMKQGNFLVMYQNVPMENSFKMSLYDLQNARLHTCLKQQFTDFTEELSFYPPVYADRFMFASPQNPKIKCFEGIYKPKIKADTLMLSLEIPERMDLLGPEFQNAYLFLSKTTGNVYFGTIDSIYYTFRSQPDLAEWDCGVHIFGDSEIGFYLLDTAKKQLSKDQYANLDTDMENSCLNEEFAAVNLRTEKRELFKVTRQGYRKLMEGNFHSFTRVQSPKDGFGRSAMYYLFFDINGKFQFATDDKFVLLFDTTTYIAEPGGDYTTLLDGGGNFLILKSKGTDENYYVLNAITKTITKLHSKPQTGYAERFLVLENTTGDKSTDLLLVETGEIMKNVNMEKGEYFVFNGKLYFREFGENDSTHLFNSSGQKIK